MTRIPRPFGMPTVTTPSLAYSIRTPLIDTSPQAVLAAAREYVDAGLSVIPIAADQSKRPDGRLLPKVYDSTAQREKASWSIFQVRRPTHEELTGWYGTDHNEPPGIAIIGGAVSRGVEVIDFDHADSFGPWSQVVQKLRAGLWQRLVRVRTPRPGVHAYYRCSMWSGYETLASGPQRGSDGTVLLDANGKPTRITLIEKKGEGGYCLAPPSPIHCHESFEEYRFQEGSPPLSQIPTVTEEERAILLGAARALNEWDEPEPTPASAARTTRNDGGRPGDDFNRRAEWTDILSPHGWFESGSDGDATRWCRPGKDGGTSATTNYAESGLLYVFSTNADPFEPNRGYCKFTAYALLNHGGDFAAAAAELRKQGYGCAQVPAGQQAAQQADATLVTMS